MSIGTNIIVSIFIVLLSILSSLFSGNEISITNIKPYQWLSWTNDTKLDSVKNKSVIKMLNNYSLTLGAILVGNTICNIVVSSLVTYVVEANGQAIYVALATGILAFIVLIFCEYLPKSIARKHSLEWMNYFWWTILAFYYLFFPISYIFFLIFDKDTKQLSASEREVKYLVKEIQKEGVLERDEASLVSNALKFDDTPVSSAMVRRYVYIDTSDSFTDIMKKFTKTQYSRMPVINNRDRAIGFILGKDILEAWAINKNISKSFKINDFLNPLHFVTCNTNLDDALRIMQRTNTHMLGVVNKKDSKKLSGIITMEIILEQLVGKIYDEKDLVNTIQTINSFTWVVDPDVNAYNFMLEHIGIKIKNKKITLETYLKSIFKFSHNKWHDHYENKNFSVMVVKSQKGNSLKYEITKL